MRIVHAIARLNVGGAALSVLELAAQQRAAGHDVLVVAGRVPPGEASMEHIAGELRVPSLHLPALQRDISPTSDAAAVRSLRDLIRRRKPDVLHTHTSKAGATGRLASALSGSARPRAVVHTFHGHVLRGYFSPAQERVYRVAERLLARACDRLIAVSNVVRDELVALRVAPPEKFAVIPYGFDLDARVRRDDETRRVKRLELGVSDDDFVVGWAGRLTAVKRPLDLITTIAAVDGSMLVLAGDGELRPDVEALAARLGVVDRVRFLGYVEDMGSWYVAFDAFLLTSLNEGSPVVAVEAQAAGVPVVATDAGGTRSIVHDQETGYVVPVGAVDELAAALTRLRDDGVLRARLGSTGAERTRREFAIERMASDIQALYDQILAA